MTRCLSAHARRVACALLLLGSTAPAVAQEAARQSADDPAARASRSRAKGREAAPVLVFEMADFQCPFCARFATEIHPRLDEEYVKTGKVRWVFVNLPLPNHPRAWIAAEAASCAGAAGNRFWPLHDRLFEAQAEWGNAPDPAALFARYAREAGVDMKAWEACVAGDQTAQVILQDMLFATSTGATGTPAFVIDREQMVQGLKSYEEWKTLLDAALARKKD